LILFLIETAMRFAGATFLVIGFLLCVSIAWAAIGFFAMGFGLIFFLIADERKKRLVLHLERVAIQRAPIDSSQPIALPPIISECRGRQDGAPCERDEWRSLVESDQELLRVVKSLEPFGQKYLDQLAGAYVAFNNRAFLPLILNMIIASARQDAGLGPVGEMNPRNSITSPNDPISLDGVGADRFSEFATVATVDQFSLGGREMDRSSRQKLAAGERSEDLAVGGGIAVEAVAPSFNESAVCENNSDEPTTSKICSAD
jgi:hypothetical protein